MKSISNGVGTELRNGIRKAEGAYWKINVNDNRVEKDSIIIIFKANKKYIELMFSADLPSCSNEN